MENLNLALTLLIAGFVIVFVVLVLLIVIITLYGKIIQFAQNAVSKKQAVKNDSETPKVKSVTREEIEEMTSNEIPDEVIAVIAAAVDSLYGSKPHKIKNIKRSRSIRSSWGNAGIAENTRPF